MKGLDDLGKKFRKMGDNVKKMEGAQEVSFSELFPQSFMKEHTSLADLQEMFDLAGIETEKDIREGNEALQGIVQKHTKFASWQEMLEKAVAVYAGRQLFSGL